MTGPAKSKPDQHTAAALRFECQRRSDTSALDDEPFTACLNRHLTLSGLSLNELSRRSWLNISYVYRLANVYCDPRNPRSETTGAHRHPSRDTVIRLGLAMRLAIENMDELLLSAGYAPLVR